MLAVLNDINRVVLNSITDAFLLETKDRKVRFVNLSFCNLFKIPLPPEDLIGYDCEASANAAAALFKHPELFITRINEILNNQIEVTDELIELADHSFYGRSYIPLFEEGELSGHLWIYKDKTNEINLYNYSKKREAYFKNILNELPADIALFTPNHKYTFVNKHAVKNEEVRNWIIGKDDFEYAALKKIPFDKISFRRKIFVDAIHEKKTKEYEDVNVDSEGEEVHNLRRYYPHLDKDGNVDYVVGYGVNITSLKHKEQLLKKSESDFKNLLFNLSEAALLLDENYIVKFANPKWNQIFGVTTADTIGKPLFLFTGKNIVNDLVKMVSSISELETNKVKTKDFNIKNKFGDQKFLKFRISIHEENGKKGKTIMLFVSDETEQVNAANQLLSVVKKEREMLEQKSSFVTMLSHEMRTPIAILQSTLDLLLMEIQTNKTSLASVGNELSGLTSQLTRMTDIMNSLNLMNQQRNDWQESKNHTSITLKNFILNHIKGDYFPYTDGRLLETIFRGHNKKIKIDVQGKRVILCQVLDNAFKYSSNQVKLLIRGCNTYFSILCVDYGIGIGDNDQLNLFKLFKRGENVGSIAGTGMGLVQVSQLLKEINGYIKLRSKINKGTIVYIKIPFQE